MIQIKLMSGEVFYTSENISFGARTISFYDIFQYRQMIDIDQIDYIELAKSDEVLFKYIREYVE